MVNQARNGDLPLMESGTSKQCTLMLTTHYLDEADMLGTRIGIMVAGQMTCCATSQRLKTRYATSLPIKPACLVLAL